MIAAYARLVAERESARMPAPGEPFASDPRELRAWLDALPLANLAVAAERIEEGLQALNAQALAPGARLEALELMRAPMLQLAGALDRQIIGGGFPLPPQQEGYATLALGFQRELACGYRLCLVDFTAPSGTVPLLRGRQVAMAAVRALQHGGEHLAQSCLLYRTPERGAWQAMHDVHGLACALRLERRAVADPVQGLELDAHLAYLQALLFALANPYHYTQREQVEARLLTGALAAKVRLRERGAATGGVPVPLASDRGPGQFDQEGEGESREVNVLDLDALLADVHERVARANGARAIVLPRQGQNGLEVEVAALQQLAASLAEQRERSNARIGGDHMLDTVLGLHDLHCRVAGRETFETFLQRVPGGAAPLVEGERPAWRPPSAALQCGASRRARVLDQGLGGYRILWSREGDTEGVRARVGELVGLALPAEGAEGQDDDWMVGVIRWLRIDAGGGVECGVRLLSRRPLPVAMQVLRAGAARSPLRGLLLEPLHGAWDAACTQLLSSTEIERDAHELEIAMPIDTVALPQPARRLRLRDLPLVEDGATFRIFSLPAQAADATSS